jgi:hypothetical protein
VWFFITLAILGAVLLAAIFAILDLVLRDR